MGASHHVRLFTIGLLDTGRECRDLSKLQVQICLTRVQSQTQGGFLVDDTRVTCGGTPVHNRFSYFAGLVSPV